jgi:signal peptidase I
MTSRKLVAVVLAFFGPWGVGHFHLGRRRRAFVWLMTPIVGLFILGALVPVIGTHAGWGIAVALPFVWMLAMWIGSFVDLLRTGDAGKVPVWQTVAFFVVGLAGPVAASRFVQTFVLASYVVPTQSMQPTVLAGDRLFASRSDKHPRYGDVIVLESPEHPDQLLVKRVIALPGDVLEVRRGHPLVNGWRVPTCVVGSVNLDGEMGELDVEFLGDASYLVFYDAATPVPEHAGPLYAAADSVLVLGDNRNDSADSRTWHHGIDGNVPRSALEGRALFVWLRTSTVDDRHFGIGLAGVQLPSSLAHFGPDVSRCLATKPDANPPPALHR